jgi:hypothetical protein
MAGLEHEMAAGDGRGRLRASDSDRERVIDTLKAAYVHGLVTKDEFDERVSQTLASRTRFDLTLVTADLLGAQQQPWPVPARSNAPAQPDAGPGNRAIIATAVFAGLALVTSISAGAFASWAMFLLLLGGAGSALLSLFLLGKRMRSQQTKGPGSQPPLQRRVGSGPSAAHRAVSATSAEPFKQAAKPRRSKADAAGTILSACSCPASLPQSQPRPSPPTKFAQSSRYPLPIMRRVLAGQPSRLVGSTEASVPSFVWVS